MNDDKILTEGINLYNRKNYTGALTYFLSLPENCGADSLELAYYLGLCYAKLGRYDDALLYLEQVVTAEGEATTAGKTGRICQCRYLLAVIYSMSGRKKLSDFELRKLLDSGYKSASVYASLAYLSWQDGQIDDAIQLYRKALEEDSENLTALNGLGYVMADDDRDLTTALAYCKKAIKISPDSAACLDSIGWVYYKMGLFNEAIRYLQSAHKKDITSAVIADHLKEAERNAE